MSSSLGVTYTLYGEMSGTAKDVARKLTGLLFPHEDILFAYLHGSILRGEVYNDIDLAIYLVPEKYTSLNKCGELNLEYIIPLETELNEEFRDSLDIQVLNGAPLAFRYRVVNQGCLLFDKSEGLLFDFEYLSRVKYFDFRPRLQEYLKATFGEGVKYG